MRSIADAEEPRSVPLPQSIDLHGEELDRFPTLEFLNPIRRKRCQLSDALTKRDQPLRLDVTAGAFRDHEPTLPVVCAVQHDEDAAAVKAAHRIDRIAGTPREPEPEHIHWRPEFFDRKSGPLAHYGMPAIGTDHQVCANLQRSFSRIDGEPNDLIAVPYEIRHLCAHAELKRVIALFADSIRASPEAPPFARGHIPLNVRPGQLPQIGSGQGYAPIWGRTAI